MHALPSPDLEDYVRALLDPDHGLPLWDPVQGLFTGEHNRLAPTTCATLEVSNH